MRSLLIALMLIVGAVSADELSNLVLTQRPFVSSGSGGGEFPAGAVAYWKFDEGTPTYADFFTGNDLATSGFDPSSAAGIVNNCGTYSPGSFTHVIAADSADLDFGTDVDATISFWVRPAVVNAFRYVLGKDAAGTGYQILITSSGFIRLSLPGTAAGPFDSTLALTANEWYFIVFTYDQSDYRIYINGALDSTHSETTDIPTNSDTLQVGRSEGANGYWDGRIDELGIWKRALDGAEVLTLDNNGNGLQP